MSDELVELRYRGPVTVGTPGCVRLHDRDGGLSELIWDAVGEAGWLGHVIGLKPTLDLTMRVPGPSRDEPKPTAELSPLPGEFRRPTEPGRVAPDGSVSQHYVGPVHPRSARGLRLVEVERRAEDFDSYENLLFAAAGKAGWMPPNPYEGCSAEIADVEITVRITAHIGE
jgi:hypothetical protein